MINRPAHPNATIARANGEGWGVRCSATEGGSDQEQNHGNRMEPADRVADDQSAEEKLAGADDHYLNTAAPADILEGVEFV